MTQSAGPAQNLPHALRCYNHPDREGLGICVSCRAVVCVECSTKVDRMNYCIRCLQAAAPKPRAVEQPDRDRVLGVPAALLAFFLSAGGFALLGLLLDLLRRMTPAGVSAG